MSLTKEYTESLKKSWLRLHALAKTTRGKLGSGITQPWDNPFRGTLKRIWAWHIKLFPNSLFRVYVTAIPALNRKLGNNLMCHPVLTWLVWLPGTTVAAITTTRATNKFIMAACSLSEVRRRTDAFWWGEGTLLKGSKSFLRDHIVDLKEAIYPIKNGPWSLSSVRLRAKGSFLSHLTSSVGHQNQTDQSATSVMSCSDFLNVFLSHLTSLKSPQKSWSWWQLGYLQC